MKKQIKGISGVLIGLVVGGFAFSLQTTPTRSTVTDSVVQPTSGQTAVQLTSSRGRKGHVEIKTQTTTSQAGKTVSRQTTTTNVGQPVRKR